MSQTQGTRTSVSALGQKQCPTTNQQCECDVATDAVNLAKVWKMTKDIKCRICGEMHKIKIRDAFLDMVMAREIVITR